MLEPFRVAAQLRQLAPRAKAYRVGFSGGRDSTALLHCLALQRRQLAAQLSAIHIDHGLHADSNRWAMHCRQVCAALQVPLTIRPVHVAQDSAEGLEAAARRERYNAFSDSLETDECLVLAHHADDQAETFLLRTLRGGGLTALSSIPAYRPLVRASIARPLLEFSTADIDKYLRRNNLAWIDDPANAELAYDRVYIRRRVIPQLKQRWPDTAVRLSNSVATVNNDRHLLNRYLDADLYRIRHPGGHPSVARLAELDEQLRLAVMRRWFECSGVRPPPREQLLNGLHSLISAAPDAAPEVKWTDATLRRYRNQLYLFPNCEHQSRPINPNQEGRLADPEGASGETDVWPWQAQSPLHLPGGTLEARLSPARGLDPCYRGQNLEVRWPPTAARHSAANSPNSAAKRDNKRRKRLYQQIGVPPWERIARPLIYLDGRPVAVAGYGSDYNYSNRPGLRLLWLK